MTEEEEFEFEHQLEKERAKAAAAGPATGNTNTGRSKDIKFQSATDILKDVAVGGLKSATNVGTHLVDAATVVPEKWADVAQYVAPGVAKKVKEAVGSVREAGQEGRDFWRQQYEAAGPSAGLGSFATDVAASGGVTRPAAKVATAILPKVKNVLNRASLTGGIAGGTSGALTSDDSTSGGVTGTIVGAALPRVLSKAILGINKSPSGQALLDEGVPLTIGQGAERRGTGTAISGFESGGKFIPIGGNAIENRQAEAVEAWRQAALRRGNIPETPTGGPAVPAPEIREGDVLEAVRQQRGALKAAQARAVTGTKFAPDEELEKKLLELTTDPNRMIDAEGARTLQKTYEKTLFNRIRGDVPQAQGSSIIIPGGRTIAPQPTPSHWTGEDVQRARRVFERYGRRLQSIGKNDPFKEGTGKAMTEFADEILNMIERQNAPVGQSLRALQGPAANLKVLSETAENAAGLGGFTPEQLIKQAGRRGNTDLETLARQGSDVFRATNTGVRQGSGLRSLGNMISGIANILHPETTALTLGPVALYRPGVQKMMLGETKAQKALADYLRRSELSDLVGGPNVP